MSVNPRWLPKTEMTWHPRSIPTGHLKPAGLKKDVNSMRSVEHNKIIISGKVQLPENQFGRRTELF